jgi:hypothetical protein
MNKLIQTVRDIETTPDLLERALKLAGLVTRIFRDAGWDKELDELRKEVARELKLTT